MLHGAANQRIGTLALALEPNIMVNSIGMSWQRVYLPLKSYIVMLMIKLLHDVAAE
jgi:hypothetical protein